MSTVIFIAVTFAILYLGTFYAAPAVTKSFAESNDPSREVKVFRNFFLGLMLFVATDGVIFHSGLYESILKPDSYAGKVSSLVRYEKARKGSGKQEILVMGDSRIEAGFVEEAANSLAEGKNINFLKRTIARSGPRLWYYFLREVDPFANRYRMIVLPLKFEDVDLERTPAGNDMDIIQISPLLRYTDAYSFASSFRHRKDQYKAFTACLLRGTAYQSDLFDFLENPAARFRRIRSNLLPAPGASRGRIHRRDVSGLSYDPYTKRITFPERFSRMQKKSIRMSLVMLQPGPHTEDSLTWSNRIVGRYASTDTTIVFVPMPRGPLGSLVSSEKGAQSVSDKLPLNAKAVLLDEHEFNFLEKPEYFIDGFHLNGKGQPQFTQRLTEKLLARLQTAEVSQDQQSGGLSQH